jgi:hypothetical protein
LGEGEHDSGRAPQWDGIVQRDEYKPAFVQARDELADAGRAGRWDRVLGLLRDPARQLEPNHWRVGGQSWFTPLHQAAWHGAPGNVASELIAMGASRTLPTADGRSARDLAAATGHDELLPLLEPAPRNPTGEGVLARLDRRLVELIEQRIRPHLTIELRPFPTVLLTEFDRGARAWFPIPGMCGGFSIALMRNYLDVESWSRVVGGSGQAHVITVEETVLVDEGFV